MFNIGINVVETEGNSTPAIAGAPTSVAGLILRSCRGPVGQAVRVSSFQQFISRFEGHDCRFMGAYCIEGFFLNGGKEAYITRIIGNNSQAASVTLKDRTGANNLDVIAGYRGKEEPGEWGNGLYIDIIDNPEFSTLLTVSLDGNQPARLHGNAISNFIDLSSIKGENPHPCALLLDVTTSDSANPTRLTVTLDETSIPVPAKATTGDIVKAINDDVLAGHLLLAKEDANGILLVSRLKGESASIKVVTSADKTEDLLGFAANQTAHGTSNTNDYVEAAVKSLAGFKIGDWVRLEDGISQNWLQITDLKEKIDGDGKKQYIVCWNATTLKDAEKNEYRVDDEAKLSTTEFDLVVKHQNSTDSQLQQVELWSKLTMDNNRANYAPHVVNDLYTGSSYIMLNPPNAFTFKGSNVPAQGKSIRFGLSTPNSSGLNRTEGTDGNEPSLEDYKRTFTQYDTIPIQLFAIPEAMEGGMLNAVTNAAIGYCAGKGDCMFVGHTPNNLNTIDAKSFGQNFRSSKVFGALYWPWITVIDPIGIGRNSTKVIPPTGHVLGVYARIDQTRGIWKAPAGNEAIIRGALAVERDITDIDHTDLVKNGSVNGIRNIRGQGIVIDSSRTLSTDTRWLYVNVRLLFNYVKASLRDGLSWVKQEPNREALWNMIKYNAITPFLLRLYKEGAFGTGKPEDVFTVIVGPENNPPHEVMLGNLKVEVYFYPSRPAETIIITIGQQESKATTSEA